MRSLLLLALITALPTPAPPALETGTCAGVPRPQLERVTVFEPDPARYAEPDANQPGVYEVREDGAAYTFTDQGTGEGHLCPGSDTRYYFTSTRIVSSAFPKCWKTVTETVSDCADPPAENPADLWPEPTNVDPDYKEDDPIGPTDDGKPGAGTVDKPG
jgi:hypothetical protein